MGASTRKRLLELISSQLSCSYATHIKFNEGSFKSEMLFPVEIEFTMSETDSIVERGYSLLKDYLSGLDLQCKLGLAFSSYGLEGTTYKFRIESKKNIDLKNYESQSQKILFETSKFLRNYSN